MPSRAYNGGSEQMDLKDICLEGEDWIDMAEDIV
jgi:hypothetical protein